MTYQKFLGLLTSFANVSWVVTPLGTIRTDRSSKSLFSIICEEMMQLDIAGEDYRGAEALGLSKKDARKIVRAMNGSEGYDTEVRKDLLRAVGLLGLYSNRAGA